ncbi:MAG: hypothetical protein ABIP11_01215 [Luteimonas sp.]
MRERESKSPGARRRGGGDVRLDLQPDFQARGDALKAAARELDRGAA